MGRLVLIALVLSALGGAAILALGGVELSAEQRAEIAAQERAVRPVPPGDDPVPAAPATRPVVLPAPGPLGATVAMDRLEFGAQRTEVKAGESVRWVNRDRVAHDILSDDAVGAGAVASFDSGVISPGKDFRTTFETPGLVRYVCVLHPTSMLAYVVVTER